MVLLNNLLIIPLEILKMFLHKILENLFGNMLSFYYLKVSANRLK